ncbi:3-methyl-2-oxobutanoate hydroxymethyltransferase [Candidatus Margulisiibacteriota bacterium]
MKNKIWPQHIIDKKKNGQKIIMLTAYDYLLAKLLDDMEIDIILVGDSLGNMFCGYDNTLPVTIDQMIYHTQAVARAAKNTLVVADMPFLSYQVSVESAKLNAGRLLKEGGAKAVKVEVCSSNISYISEMLDIGIPIMAHIGFTPQNTYKLGGYRVQGKTKEDSQYIIDLAKRCEEAGCFSVVLEMVPAKLAAEVSKVLSIPTIGIGAGPGCDGQVLVTQDLLGFDKDFAPKFVKKYVDLNQIIRDSVNSFKQDVKNGKFPDKGSSF